MERILVVNVNWVGDVIFSSPIFKALKDKYPQAHVCCMAVPRVKQVLECVPYIDEIIVYEDKGKHFTPIGKLKLILELRRRKFDIAFLLHRSLTRALLVFFAGIKHRVGYDEKNRGKFLTYKVDFIDGQLHRSDHYLNVIESFGVPVNSRQCQLDVNDEASKKIEDLLKANGINNNDCVIVVNPGGNWDLKRWSLDNFRKLICGLNELSVKIIISGAQKDKVLGEHRLIKRLDNVTDLAGRTSLKQVIALMKRADIVISADSGPLHMANSVGSEVIGLFGPTRAEITGPRGGGHAHVLQNNVGCNLEPCYHLKCPDNICMKSIGVYDVLETVKKIRNK